MAMFGHLSDIRNEKIVRGRMAAALEYLCHCRPDFLNKKPVGYTEKIAIDGTRVFAIHQVYRSKPIADARYEAHRQYCDIQMVWGGEEYIGVYPLRGLTVRPRVTMRYNAKKDIVFYTYVPGSLILLKKGMACILWPTDLHAPCLAITMPGIVRKTVVKVMV